MLVPPSRNRLLMPCAVRVCLIDSGVMGCEEVITVATWRSAANCCGSASAFAITIFSPLPSVKNRALGSKWPLALTVTLIGSAGRPCARRCSRSVALRVTKAGLSLRMVSAPTSTASQAARSARTCSQSSALERTNLCGVLSSMYPSKETAVDAQTIIIGKNVRFKLILNKQIWSKFS